MQDKDLAPLRERREWLDALDGLKGGISDSALVHPLARDIPAGIVSLCKTRVIWYGESPTGVRPCHESTSRPYPALKLILTLTLANPNLEP